MEYIQNNMCDNSKVYKFETFREQQSNPLASDIQENKSNMDLGVSNSGGATKPEDTDKAPFGESQANPKISKMSKQNLNRFDNLQKLHNKKVNSEETANGDKHSKMFKITKPANGKKDSSQGSFYNISSEEQKNEYANYPFIKRNMKSSKEGSDGDSGLSTKGSTSYICLEGGKIIIKGNEIETVVP